MPTFDNVADIQAAIKSQEEIFSDSRGLMEDDFDMIFGESSGFTPKGTEYHEFIDPAPHNFFNKVMDGNNRALIRIAIKVPEDATDKEKAAASDGELFIFGALHQIDRRLLKRQQKPLREGLSWFGSARGWEAMRLIVHVPDGEKDVAFDCVPWDLLHTTWESAADGLVWAAYKRWITKTQAKAEYGDEIGDEIPEKGTQAIDFWDREGNSVIVGDKFIKANVPHGLDHVPVFINSVGSMPTVLSRDAENGSDSGNTLKFQGQSVLAAWRDIIGPHNEEVSFYQDVASDARDAPLVYETETGTKGLEDTPYGSFKVIRLKSGEVLKPIELPKTPPESAVVLDVIQRGRLEAALPQPISHGGSNAPESGIALAIRIDQTRSVYTPGTEILARAYQWLCEELIIQTKIKAGKKRMRLAGFDSQDEFFRITMTPGKLDPTWFFDVRVEPRLPRDETEEANRFMLLTAPTDGGEAGLSYDTAREEILKLRNPAAEAAKVLRESMERLPPIQATRLAKAAQEGGGDEEAQVVLDWGVQERWLPQPRPEAPEDGDQPAATGDGPAATGGDPAQDQQIQQLVDVLDQIAQALQQAGMQEGRVGQLLQPFADWLQGGQPPAPEAIQQLIDVLQQIGADELAQTLIQLLQGGGGAQGAPVAAG